MTTTKKVSPTRALAAKVIHAGLSILRDNGKELPVRDLMEKIEKAVSLAGWRTASAAVRFRASLASRG